MRPVIVGLSRCLFVHLIEMVHSKDESAKTTTTGTDRFQIISLTLGFVSVNLYQQQISPPVSKCIVNAIASAFLTHKAKYDSLLPRLRQKQGFFSRSTAMLQAHPRSSAPGWRIYIALTAGSCVAVLLAIIASFGVLAPIHRGVLF